ncbi:MAG: hypothetical protein FWF06_08720 [Symbiobacteriaceae bacterium]|nr:hypothetical protein [Symbiobacteriaceae bacterium]
MVFLLVCSFSVPAWAALPSSMSQERQDEYYSQLVSIIKRQTTAVTSMVNSLVSREKIKELVKDRINHLLEAGTVKELLAGSLEELIRRTLDNNLALHLPDTLDLEAIIGEVLSNDTLNRILTSEFVATVVDRTIDNLLEGVAISAILEGLSESVLQQLAGEIWNDGNPKSGSSPWLGQTGPWHAANETWNENIIAIINAAKLGLSTSSLGNSVLVSSVMSLLGITVGNIEDYVDIAQINLTELFSPESLLKAIYQAINETAHEYYLKYQGQLQTLVEARIAEAKAKIQRELERVKGAAKVVLVRELNSIFGASLTTTMTLREIINHLEPVIDSILYANRESYANRLSALRTVAELKRHEDFLAAIDTLILRLNTLDYCAKHGYNWVKGETTRPTCSLGGYTSYSCSICHESKRDDFTPALAHNWLRGITAATCTTQGEISYLCRICGATMTKETAPLGHNWEWFTTTPATCHSRGREQARCTYCRTLGDTRVIPALNHEMRWVTITAATCTTRGSEQERCRFNCGEVGLTRTTPTLAHSYTWQVLRAATCTQGGSEVERCQNGCGTTRSTRATAPIDHSWEWVISKAPTCTAPGLEEYRCKFLCGAVSTTKSVRALGHKYAAVITPATPLSDGYTTFTCTLCQDCYRSDYTKYASLSQPTTPPSSGTTARFISISETSKNSRQWQLSFEATLTNTHGSSSSHTYQITLSANNANVDGSYTFPSGHALAGYTLHYDIKGNGSNIKRFELRK